MHFWKLYSVVATRWWWGRWRRGRRRSRSRAGDGIAAAGDGAGFAVSSSLSALFFGKSPVPRPKRALVGEARCVPPLFWPRSSRPRASRLTEHAPCALLPTKPPEPVWMTHCVVPQGAEGQAADVHLLRDWLRALL